MITIGDRFTHAAVQSVLRLLEERDVAVKSWREEKARAERLETQIIGAGRALNELRAALAASERSTEERTKAYQVAFNKMLDENAKLRGQLDRIYRAAGLEVS